MTMDPGEPIKIPSTTIAIDNESVSFTSESLIPRTFNVYRGSSLCSSDSFKIQRKSSV